ncbi:molybdate ABC transporter substrate-binding protein [soil metagenome]
MAGLFVGLFVAACSPRDKAPSAPVTVFAAASLTDALGEIAAAYERTSGQTVRLSFGASGSIARQIQAGAPADVVVLADPVWMERLQAADLLAPGTRADLLRNRLVLIAAADARTGADPFAWLSETDGKLVIGDPESVPAGAYARTWLQTTGRWNGLQTRIVTAADVRAVRTFVERGEAGLGIVYRSDTIGAPAVKIVAEPAVSDQPAIVYPVASTRAGALRAAPFLAFLHGPEAARIFAAHGFEPIP